MATLQLRAGDILLYRPKGIFGRLIQMKTWHRISHVEIYAGNQQSYASRDGKGVECYPIRLTELAFVLRPTRPLDLVKGRAYFDSMRGTPYGWLDLLDFAGFNVDKKGIICSAFAAEYLRACGWNVFPTDKANLVSPFQFLDLIGSGCDVAYGPDPLAEAA
jgi:hypothetical protein